MNFLREKFHDDSDGIQIPICRRCCNIAIVNEKIGLYKCRECGDRADIAWVESTWSANIFFNEMRAMHNKMQFELDTNKFEAV